MENRDEELHFLANEYRKNPELFEKRTILEDSAFLSKFGIFILGQDKFPKGYIKLWQSDFVVEEISSEGVLCTVAQDSCEFSDNKEGATVYATLVKCGVSTLDAISELARLLRCDESKIQYSGIKDEYALTSQRISVRGTSISVVCSVSSTNFFLKDIVQGKGVLRQGVLNGNRFSILVRTVDEVNSNSFMKRLDRICEEGFYNFYYLQRFGTPRLLNPYWGLLILQGRYEQVVKSIICDSGEGELLYIKKLRGYFSDNFGNWILLKETISKLPLMFSVELRLIEHLERHPNDFRGALGEVSSITKLLVYSLSSLFFNEKISKFLKENIPVPKILPHILTWEKKDWMIYEEQLRDLSIFPPPFRNLRAFPGIKIGGQFVPTRAYVKVHNVKFIREGIVIDFTLPKGSYATTFLSHLFQLVSGAPPEWVSDTQVDVKELLDQESLRGTLKYFESCIRLKSKNILD
jgi:tRNA pseudouridine13 synthase